MYKIKLLKLCMDYSYGFSANQFPPCSNPNAVPMTLPRQTISAIDEEEVPDMTVKSLPAVALESVEPSISPATSAGDVTGCHTICVLNFHPIPVKQKPIKVSQLLKHRSQAYLVK